MRRRLFRKRIMIFGLLLILIISIVACSNNSKNSSNKNQYSLSITKEGKGTVEPSEGVHRYDKNAVVLLNTENTAAGWYFSKWGGPDGSDVAEDKILMDGDKSITAVFKNFEYNLNVTVIPEDAGQVYKEILASIQSIGHGETVRLTAVGNTGYAFDHWEGALDVSDNPATLEMDGDKDVTAVFTKLDYNLNLAVYPDSSGTVTTNITEETVTLTASPETGYVFDHWEGDLFGNTNPAEVTMDSEKNITAVFVKNEYELIINITPEDAGWVDVVTLPVLLSIEHGERVRLTATGNTGYAFDHWEGNLSGSDNPLTLTMDGDKEVTAVFVKGISGRVFGANSLTGIEGISINFSDGSSTITDSQGYWSKKGISGTITVIPVGSAYLDSVFTPVNREITWPAEDINFTFSGYRFIRKWGSYGSGDGQLYYPTGIAEDSSGNIYVADNHNHRIQVFDSTGTFISKWGSEGSGDGQFYNPIGIAVDDSSNIYIAEYGNHRIQVFDSTGTFISKWGSYGSGDGQLYYPTGIAEDSSGNIYVADNHNHRIQVFDRDGTFIRKWGSKGSGDGQFDLPDGIVVDSGGNVYVTDYRNHRIQVFDSAGNFIRKWGLNGSGDGQFYEPRGIVVDDLGNVYVVDSSNHRIQVFDSTGTFIRKWGSNGSGDGQLYYPFGIAVDDYGNVYVTDSGNNRIQVFELVD